MTPPPPRVLLVAHGGGTDLSVRRPALSEAGFDVDTAETASGAIGLLSARRYAAIVTDCDFPDLPALDWLAAIRGAAPETPLVIYVAASGGIEGLRDYAVDFGAAAVIAEQPSPAQLVEAVRAVVGHAK